MGGGGEYGQVAAGNPGTREILGFRLWPALLVLEPDKTSLTFKKERERREL
jgi:hypothetical protein